MALILAIEPDRRQVLKLAMLVRKYPHTELVVTDTIGRALALLDERLPDVILTSFQLGPRGNHGVADGCDPVVFGRQIAECLGRVTADRRSAPVTKWAPPQGFAAATEPASSSLARPEWRELLSTMRRDLDQMKAEQERASAARFVDLDAFRDTGKAPVKKPA